MKNHVTKELNTFLSLLTNFNKKFKRDIALKLILKVFYSLVISYCFIGISHANISQFNELTEKAFRMGIDSNKFGYICRNYHYKFSESFKSKPLKFPYPYGLDTAELKQLYLQKLNREATNAQCSSVIEDPSADINDVDYQATDIELDIDYTKNVYVTFVLDYYTSYKKVYFPEYYYRRVISDTIFFKELPLILTDADYSKLYNDSVNAIIFAGKTKPRDNRESNFEVYDDVMFHKFNMLVSKTKNHSWVENGKKSIKNHMVIESWKPEFVSQPTQAIQSVNTAVEKTTQKTQDKPSVPSTATNKSEALQKAEQEKIIKAEIKKEVAVAQVENKAQLTQDKALPVVKKVDDDVQKALKKIPKKEKKKVELKPYLETVVVCRPPSERGSFKCYGPNGSFSGHPNQPKGYKTPEEVVTINMKWSCPDQKRFASVNNHSIWGCGFGATGNVSSKDSSQGLPIPERATYYCKPKQFSCKNQSPTQAEN